MKKKQTRPAMVDLVKQRDQFLEETGVCKSLLLRSVTRELLLDAFAALRKQGFLAIANHMCCQGCASSDLNAKAIARAAKHGDGRAKGIVFWHRQDEEGWQESGGMYLAFSSATNDKDLDIGWSTVEVGKAVVLELVKRGVRAEWDGTTNHRIWVTAY